jgi:hypothetical protein
MKNDETHQHMGKMGPYGWNLITWNYMAMWMQLNDIAEIMSPIGLCGWTWWHKWNKLATRMKYKFMWMELDHTIEHHSHECTWMKLMTSMDTIFFVNERKNTKCTQPYGWNMETTMKLCLLVMGIVEFLYIHYFNCMYNCDGLQLWSILSMKPIFIHVTNLLHPWAHLHWGCSFDFVPSICVHIFQPLWFNNYTNGFGNEFETIHLSVIVNIVTIYIFL